MLKNITSNNPCGNDIKYDDKYIEIETEIEKNFNVSNTDTTKWDRVISQCEDLLKNNTKDLKLLSYWLYAQKRFNNWDDFLISFEIYTKVLLQYNNNLYPEADRRKIKILEWIENVLEDELLNALENFNKEKLTHISSILDSLENAITLTVNSKDSFFKDSQKKSSSMLLQIEDKINEEKRLKEIHEQKLLKQEEEERILSETQKLRRSEEEETLSKFSLDDTSKIIDDKTVLTSSDIDDCLTNIINISSSLFKKAPADYFSYKLLFSLGEMLIEEALINNAILDDLIPSDDIISVARNLTNNKVSINQLNALIEQLLIRPTWIEGYYIISQIFYKLNRQNDAIKLEDMLFTFLKKEKVSLEKNNMIPESMDEWLQTKILSLQDNKSNTIEYQHTYQEVLKIKKEQSEQNALMLLEDYYQKAKTQESRFRWKLLFVDFALEIGDRKVALSLLLELEKLIEKYSINQWQPELAIITYETFLKPILAQELKGEVKERIYNKLSILDIKKVIKLH